MMLAVPLPQKPVLAVPPSPKKHLEFDFDDVFGGGPGPSGSSPPVFSRFSRDGLKLSAADPETELPSKAADGSYSLNLDEPQHKVGLDDFALKYCLGRGAFGKVVLVEKNDNHNLYAMKVLKKSFLIESKNVEYTRTERDILRTVRHPFLCSLHYAFQTAGKLYLVMDFLSGGQLLFHLRREAMLSEVHVRFYAAEVVLALDHLHQLGIIHRDLKPENILLDSDGHVCITDFGLSKDRMEEGERTNTFCGTVEYMAPEMISGGGYDRMADWWSFGILLYDMLSGNPPFRHKNQTTLQQMIVKDKIKYAAFLTSDAVSLLKNLLNRDVTKRLGSGPRGVGEIKSHVWFKGTKWAQVADREAQPPIKPQIDRNVPIGCFDAEYTEEKVLDTPVEQPLSPSHQHLFSGFSYVRSIPEEFELDEHTEESSSPAPPILTPPPAPAEAKQAAELLAKEKAEQERLAKLEQEQLAKERLERQLAAEAERKKKETEEKKHAMPSPAAPATNGKQQPPPPQSAKPSPSAPKAAPRPGGRK